MVQEGLAELLVLEKNPLDNITSMLRRMLNELHSPTLSRAYSFGMQMPYAPRMRRL